MKSQKSIIYYYLNIFKIRVVEQTKGANKMNIKLRSFIGVMLASTILLTGCGEAAKEVGKEKSSADMAPYGKYEEPVEFTVGKTKADDLTKLLKGDTIENNSATRYLEQQANIKGKILWETADFDQKVALSISTGDIPDVMVVYEDLYRELVENDLVADLSEVYEKTASDSIKDRLNSYEVDVIKQTTIDGELKAIPMPFYYYEHTLTWVRRDWVEKVGAKMPETKEDLYNLARTFVEKDAAGNGKTVGFTSYADVAGLFGAVNDLNPIFNASNAFPRQWINKGDSVEYGSIQPEVRDVLEELSELYKEGVYDKQFAVRTADESNGLRTDSLGIHFGPFWISQFDFHDSINADPKADWVPIGGPLNEEGKFVSYRSKPIIKYIVVRKGYENPEAIMRAINLIQDFNFELTDEAKEFRQKEFGESIEYPRNYAPIDFTFAYADQNKKDYEAMVEADKKNNGDDLPKHLQQFWDSHVVFKEKGMEAGADDWGRHVNYYEGLKEAVGPQNEYVQMGYYGKTKSMKTKWTNLKKLEDETFLKIIMGEEPITTFDEFVKTWKKSGGEQITKEVNEEANQLK